jgi:hypothetical protein
MKSPSGDLGAKVSLEVESMRSCRTEKTGGIERKVKREK